MPVIDDANCTNTDGNYTCGTELDNVVDVYYFDTMDTFSCPDQVIIYFIINADMQQANNSV